VAQDVLTIESWQWHIIARRRALGTQDTAPISLLRVWLLQQALNINRDGHERVQQAVDCHDIATKIRVLHASFCLRQDKSQTALTWQCWGHLDTLQAVLRHGRRTRHRAEWIVQVENLTSKLQITRLVVILLFMMFYTSHLRQLTITLSSKSTPDIKWKYHKSLTPLRGIRVATRPGCQHTTHKKQISLKSQKSNTIVLQSYTKLSIKFWLMRLSGAACKLLPHAMHANDTGKQTHITSRLST
jgi:hypothetical protein